MTIQRLSLDQKIAYCMRFGTLKTLSRKEALTHFHGIYNNDYLRDRMQDELHEVNKAYDMGKYYCAFIVSPEHETRFDTVYQINTLGTFVRDIVYFLLTD